MINSVTLERMTFAAQQYISPELAADFGNVLSVQVLEQQLFGMKILIDPTVPVDTIELRDGNDRIVGKIYNIG